MYDHVVLPDRIGKLAADGVLDPIPVELEVVPRDRELCHVANRILCFVSTQVSLSAGCDRASHGPEPAQEGLLP